LDGFGFKSATKLSNPGSQISATNVKKKITEIGFFIVLTAYALLG
jgi:hypothetical protein